MDLRYLRGPVMDSEVTVGTQADALGQLFQNLLPPVPGPGPGDMEQLLFWVKVVKLNHHRIILIAYDTWSFR